MSEPRSTGPAGIGSRKRAVLEACLKAPAVALLILCANALALPGKAIAGGGVTAEVTAITHRHAGEYSIEITVANMSPGPIDSTDSPFRFSVQSEILGQWIDLASRRDGPAGSTAAPLLPGEKRKASVSVTMPARLPHLYRNREGDVNMRFQYSFRCPDRRNCSGEGAYWVTPGTDRWVLREGM